ncbi:MAG: RraA family protein [Planctomycetota bacterium]|nr:MAG: RraA family protein [Planctomycetota bacterium]
MQPADPGASDLAPACQLLSSANLSDALDRLGVAGAPHGIVPLWPGCPKAAGSAYTLQLVPPEEAALSPVRGTLEAVAAAPPGAVLVIAHSGRLDVNSFGGIAAFTARQRGLAGCVIDGVTRDVDEMRALDFPVYGRGVIQQSVRGRCACAGHGIAVRIGDVRVAAGDLVLADENGVVIVPHEHAREALRLAGEFAAAEQRIVDAIRSGMDPVAAHERLRYDGMTRSGPE